MKILKYISITLTIALVIVLLAIGLITMQKFATAPRDEFLQGQIEAKRVLVSGKVPGRIDSLLFREGNFVEKGNVIAIINSPEIEAKKIQAKGALKAARAQANKARNGARAEDVTALKAMSDRAQEAANLAKNTYERVQKLYNEGVLPLQKRDEAETQMRATQAASDAARAQYAQAVAGARAEDKAAANALVLQAKGANAEVDAYLEETKICAPMSGEISAKLAEEGEVVGAGMPIVAITDLNDSWAIFYLREDLLTKVTKGKIFKVYVPALGANIDMEVSYIAAAGDYATWRSSKDSGGFDLKSFEVRMRPKSKIKNLRPGMSVLLPMDILR